MNDHQHPPVLNECINKQSDLAWLATCTCTELKCVLCVRIVEVGRRGDGSGSGSMRKSSGRWGSSHSLSRAAGSHGSNSSLTGGIAHSLPSNCSLILCISVLTNIRLFTPNLWMMSEGFFFVLTAFLLIYWEGIKRYGRLYTFFFALNNGKVHNVWSATWAVY